MESLKVIFIFMLAISVPSLAQETETGSEPQLISAPQDAPVSETRNDIASKTQDFLQLFMSGQGDESQLISDLGLLIPPIEALGIQFGPSGYEVGQAKMASLFETGSLECSVVGADVLRSNVLAQCDASDVTYKLTGQKTDLTLMYLISWGVDGKISKIVATDLTGSLGQMTLSTSEKHLQRLLTAVVMEINQSADDQLSIAQVVSPQAELAVHNFPAPLIALLGGKTSWKGQQEIMTAVSSLHGVVEGFENLDLNLIEIKDISSNVMFAGDNVAVTHVAIEKNHFALRYDFDEDGILLRKDIFFLGQW